MPIGYYPRRMGFKPHEPYCEIIGWGKIEGSGVELCVLKASGAENLLKVNNLVPYRFYETVITFDPMKKKAGQLMETCAKIQGLRVIPLNRHIYQIRFLNGRNLF